MKASGKAVRSIASAFAVATGLANAQIARKAASGVTVEISSS